MMKFRFLLHDSLASLSLSPDRVEIEFDADNEENAMKEVDRILKSRDIEFKKENKRKPVCNAEPIELVKIVKKWCEVGMTRQMW